MKHKVKKTYTIKDAEELIWYLKKIFGEHVEDLEVIGSIKKNGKSDNDIDIYMSRFSPKDGVTERNFISKLAESIDCKKVEKTDWDGYFFKDSHFGNVDLFFDVSKFDY